MVLRTLPQELQVLEPPLEAPHLGQLVSCMLSSSEGLRISLIRIVFEYCSFGTEFVCV